MERIALVLSIFSLAACGGKGATDAGPMRYNFGIVDGANQVSTAGDAALAKRVTSQLTRDPNGTFATRVFDFLAPTIAYAQGLVLSGTPVAGAIVCGREAKAGEPQVIPLCAFTLADGKAANAVQPGTKAGKFNILFTAQVPATEPVADSTTVTVNAGAPNPNYRGDVSAYSLSPAVVQAAAVQDIYGNAVPYRIIPDSRISVQDTTTGSVGARTIIFTNTGINDIVWYVTELHGAGNVLVGYLSYSICGNGCPGINRGNWVPGGANFPNP